MKKKILLMMMILIGSVVSVSTTSQATASTSTISTYFVKGGYHIEVLHDVTGFISNIEVTWFGPGSPGYHFNMGPGYYVAHTGFGDDWCFTGRINVEDPNLGWVTLDIVCNN